VMTGRVSAVLMAGSVKTDFRGFGKSFWLGYACCKQVAYYVASRNISVCFNWPAYWKDGHWKYRDLFHDDKIKSSNVGPGAQYVSHLDVAMINCSTYSNASELHTKIGDHSRCC
jgi:hypothetical protein